jgi:hypothetical protein
VFRRVAIIAVCVIAVLGIALYALSSSPAVLRWAIRQAESGGVKIEARDLSGNLLIGVNAKDATVKLDFLTARAGNVQVRYDAWALLTRREVRVRGTISDAVVNVDPSRIPTGGEGGPGPRVVLEGVELERVRVNLNGKAWFIPDVRATILEQQNDAGPNVRPGWNGTARVKLETNEGAGTVKATYRFPEDMDFKLVLDGDLDARIARYWFTGIQSGRVLARYTITPRSFEGLGRVEDGVIEGLPGIKLTDLSGPVKHGADGVIDGHLEGALLGGPLDVRVKVDTLGQKFSVDGTAKPRLQDGLTAFKTGLSGTGALDVTVRGGGWEKVRIEGDARGAGTVAGFPADNVRARYAFTAPGDRVEITATTNSRLLDAPVNVDAGVVIQNGQVVVTPRVRGNGVLNAPLDVSGVIRVQPDGSLTAQASGQGLKGTVRATGSMNTDQIWNMQAAFTDVRAPVPLEHVVSGTATARGRIGSLEINANLARANVIVPGVVTRDYSGTVKLRQRDNTLVADGQLGPVQVQGDLSSGRLSVTDVPLELGPRISGTARYSLGRTFSLEGNATASDLVFGALRSDAISGSFRLEAGERVRASFDAPEIQAEFDSANGGIVRARPNNLRVIVADQAVRVSGNLEFGVASGNLNGRLLGNSSFGPVEVLARNNQLSISGDLRYQALEARLQGSGRLQPLDLKLDLQPKSSLSVPLTGRVNVRLGQQLEVTGSVLSGAGPTTRTINLRLQNGQPMASGSLDLRALDAVLPTEARGNLSGAVFLNFKNTAGNARFEGRYADFPVFGQARLNGDRLTASARITGGTLEGLILEGAILPRLNATARWQGTQASLRGTITNFDFDLSGPLPKLALGPLQAAGLTLPPDSLRLRGRFDSGVVTARGSFGTLEINDAQYRDGVVRASYRGDVRGMYRNENFVLDGVSGTIRYASDGANATFKGRSLTGKLERQSLTLNDYRLEAHLKPNGVLGLNLRAAQGFTRVQDSVIRTAPLIANARLEGPSLTGDLRAALTGEYHDEAFQGEAKGTLALNLEQPDQNWRGQLNAQVKGKDWILMASGPWNSLRVAGNAPTRLTSLAGITLPANFQTRVSLDGRASLPDVQYNLGFRSSLGKPVTRIEGTVRGHLASYELAARLTDPAGGVANLRYDANAHGKLELQGFDPVAFTGTNGRFDGTLALREASMLGSVSGEVAGLPVSARWLQNESFAGSLGGPVPLKLQSVRWRFPLDVAPITWQTVSGVPSATPSGTSYRANGTLRLTPEIRVDGGAAWDGLEISLPNGTARLDPVRASLAATLKDGLNIEAWNPDLGRVRYGSDGWSGGLSLPYRAWDQTGQATLTVEGALGDPTVSLETNGPISVQGNVSRQTTDFTAGLDLKVFSGLLPAELRDRTQPGRLLISAGGSLDPFNLSGTASLSGARVDDEMARLTLEGRLMGSSWKASGRLSLGESGTRFEISPDGLNAPDVDLDLRLLRLAGLAGEGRARGSAQLPGWSLKRGRGALVLDGVKVEGVQASGVVRLEDNNLGATLSGKLPNDWAFSLSGPLYPLADANLRVEELRGELKGRLDVQPEASLSLSGNFLDQPSRFGAALSGEALRLEATWATVKLTGTGKLNNNGLRLSGDLEVSDLSPIASLKGSLRAKLEANNLDVQLREIAGILEGFRVSGAARYVDGKLGLESVRAVGDELELRGAGTVLPSLGIQLQGSSTLAFAPGQVTGSLTGTLEKPIVELNGLLDAARSGLIAPGTTISARLEGSAFDVRLGGERLSGTVQGSFDGLEQFDLRLNAPIVVSGMNLPVRGQLRWDRARGFAGNLGTKGELMGRPVNASLEGRGTLEVGLDWRGAQLDLSLPARWPGSWTDALDGKLRLRRFDLGALWDKPEVLFVEADGNLAGTFGEPDVLLDGQFSGVLESSFQAVYRDNRVQANLIGDGLDIDAVLDGADWRAEGRLDGLSLDGRILPAPLERINLSGKVSAASRDGIMLDGKNIVLNGVIDTIGDVQLMGSAGWRSNTLRLDLQARALNGTGQITGTLGNPTDTLKVVLQDIPLEPVGGQGTVSTNLDLRGEINNPNLAGQVTLNNAGLPDQDWTVSGTLRPSGRVLDPNLAGTLDLGGQASGRFTLEARDLLEPIPSLSLRGSGAYRDYQLEARLSGMWPRLTGGAQLSVNTLPKGFARFDLSALGDGRYTIANPAARGELKLEPKGGLLEQSLSGRLDVKLPLETILKDAKGTVSGAVNLAGNLTRPEARLTGTLKQATYSSMELEDMKLTGVFNTSQKPIRLEAVYDGGKTVWDGTNITLEQLPVRAGGLKTRLDGQGKTSGENAPDIRVTGTLEGWATGPFEARFDMTSGVRTNLRGTLGGLPITVRASGKPEATWDGSVELNGLPKDPLEGKRSDDPNAGTLRAVLSGPFNAPKLEGEGLVAGVRLALGGTVSPLGAKLVLLTPVAGAIEGTSASGSIELLDGKISGSLRYTAGATALQLEASGTLERPRVRLEAKRSKASAVADLTLNPALSGQITITDGVQNGLLEFREDRLSGQIPNLDLSAFGIAGYGGRVRLETDLRRGQGGSFGFDGIANLTWTNVTTPIQLPINGWTLDGTGVAQYLSQPGQAERIRLEYRGTPGTIDGNLTRTAGIWGGALNLNLNGPNNGSTNKGRVTGSVRVGQDGLRGNLKLEAFKFNISGVDTSLNGNVELTGDSYRAEGVAEALGGRITLEEAQGGLSDLIPALEPYTKTKPGDLGYDVRARLDAVRLEDLTQLRQNAPYLKGRASGVVQASDAFFRFQLTVPELTLPGPRNSVKLRLSLTGNTAGRNFNVTGILGDPRGDNTDAANETAAKNQLTLTPVTYGDSFINAVLVGNELTGRLELNRAPMHALLGAVTGPLPGEALVSGLARFSLPLERPLDGNARLALEKVQLTGGGDTLTGSGTLFYRKGGFELDSLKLDGAGSWRGSGKYTPEQVNLKLEFNNTTFTPVLGLVPTLKDVDPSAEGTVKLEFSGDYLNPRAKLSIENLRGRLAGINLSAKTLTGTLENQNIQLSGQITSDETLGASLETTIKGRITSYQPFQLEGLSARGVGGLDIKPIGRFDNVVAEAFGQSGGFKLRATGKKGQGAFTIEGDLSPRLDLRLKGRNMEFSVPTYFVRESLVDAPNIRLLSEGRDYVVTGNINILRLLASSSAREQTDEKTEPEAAREPEPPTLRRDTIYDRVRFDRVRVNAPNGLRLQESFASLEAGGELILTGTAAEPQVNGQLEAIGRTGDRGTISLGPYSYAIQTATATFTPTDGILPFVRTKSQSEIVTRVERNGRIEPIRARIELTVNIRFRRNALGEIRYDIDTNLVQLTENGTCPPNPDPSQLSCLSQAELYGAATLGSATGLTPLGLGQSALNTVLNVFVLSEFTRAFRQATGVDVQVTTNVLDLLNPDISQEDRNKIGVAFSFGGYLSRQWYLQYQVDTTGRTVINLNFTTDDNRFSLRLYIPIQLNFTNAAQFLTVTNSEISASYNFSSLNSLTVSLQQTTSGSSTGFGLKLGLSFRF